MKPHGIKESVQQKMLQDADKIYMPIMGTMELLPLCNMNCRMCYVRQTRTEMDRQGRILTCDEWLPIIEAACENGLLFLTITGGEPLLYPEFRRLYTMISQMGVLLEVNTNGTLIDEGWADFFCENGGQKLNITIYGKDNATYGELCQNPQGFTQVIRAAKLLKERDVPFQFNCSLTPENIDQLSEIRRVADSYGVILSPTAYMFPGIRRGKTTQEQHRLTAEQAAMAELCGLEKISGEEALEELAKLKEQPRLKNLEGFPCHAGRSDFSINWKGELLPCLSFQEPGISLLKNSFEEAWNKMVNICKQMPQCQKCIDCHLQNVCRVCPAHCYSETGNSGSCPEYLCKMTEYKVRQLRKIAAETVDT